MIFAMIVGAMLARDSQQDYLRAKYGFDASKYTKSEVETLFKPMNRERTFDPLVFVTRLDAVNYGKMTTQKGWRP